jgi:predicted dehydrogenase
MSHSLKQPQGFVVIGLGSMGRRRIRCLAELGCVPVAGVDVRADRRAEVAAEHGIPTFSTLVDALVASGATRACVCVPPDRHQEVLAALIEARVPAFVEAGVVRDGLAEVVTAAAAAGVPLVPSNTMLFHPAVGVIRDLVLGGRIGTVVQFMHHCGHHLADWHPYEPIEDLYASRRETGGAREMTAFELRWLTVLFGFPHGGVARTATGADIPGADIHDTYALLLEFNGCLGSVAVDVASRPGTRRLVVAGTEGQIAWDWAVGHVRLYTAREARWESVGYDAGPAYPGYDASIGERMYVAELEAFLAHLSGAASFPHDWERDLRVLDLLADLEATAARSAA